MKKIIIALLFIALTSFRAGNDKCDFWYNEAIFWQDQFQALVNTLHYVDFATQENKDSVLSIMTRQLNEIKKHESATKKQ